MQWICDLVTFEIAACCQLSSSEWLSDQWQSGCGSMVVNCDKSAKIVNLLPSVANLLLFPYTKMKSSQNLVCLKQKFTNSSTNSDIAAAWLQSKYKMTKVVNDLDCYITRIQPFGNHLSPVQSDMSETGYWCRLTQMVGYRRAHRVHNTPWREKRSCFMIQLKQRLLLKSC